MYTYRHWLNEYRMFEDATQAKDMRMPLTKNPMKYYQLVEYIYGTVGSTLLIS